MSRKRQTKPANPWQALIDRQEAKDAATESSARQNRPLPPETTGYLYKNGEWIRDYNISDRKQLCPHCGQKAARSETVTHTQSGTVTEYFCGNCLKQAETRQK